MQRMIRMLKPFANQIGILKFLPVPYCEDTRLYLIPVDIAALLIVSLVERVEQRHKLSTFHVLGGGRGVSVRKVLQAILDYYQIPLAPMAIPKFAIRKPLFKLLQTPPKAVGYMNSKWTFSSKNLEEEMPGFRYPSYMQTAAKTMDYADQKFFAKEKKA